MMTNAIQIILRMMMTDNNSNGLFKNYVQKKHINEIQTEDENNLLGQWSGGCPSDLVQALSSQIWVDSVQRLSCEIVRQIEPSHSAHAQIFIIEM